MKCWRYTVEFYSYGETEEEARGYLNADVLPPHFKEGDGVRDPGNDTEDEPDMQEAQQ